MDHSHLPSSWHKHKHTHTHTHIGAILEFLSLRSFRRGSLSSFKSFGSQHCPWALVFVSFYMYLSLLSVTLSIFPFYFFSLFPTFISFPWCFPQSLGFLLINTCIFFFSVSQENILHFVRCLDFHCIRTTKWHVNNRKIHY